MNKIIVGITASIAAYKIAELIRLLKKANHDVRVVMTKSSTNIISPMTLQVLSQNKVRVDLFDAEDEAEIDHISLARWADKIVIAPATANIIAKIANGIADDLLTTICLATEKPIVIAPAMNRAMWDNQATKHNISILENRGYSLLLPSFGEQACGENGIGRMQEPKDIINSLLNNSFKPLLGKNILITAGPTIEQIDPVRFISNYSSGKMGYAIAKQAKILGANVTLISGKTNLTAYHGVKLINVLSVSDMLEIVMNNIKYSDWFVSCAAVSDYTIEKTSKQKIKKTDRSEMSIKLIKSPDIISKVAGLPNKPFILGFAAETENLLDNAKIKREKKSIDLIAANDVSDKEIGFNSDDNAITLIGEGFEKTFDIMPKDELARKLLLACLDYNDQIIKSDF